MTVSIAADHDPVAPADSVLWTIDVHNPGNITATAVTVTDTLYSSLQILNADFEGIISEHRIDWPEPFDLESGDHAIRQVWIRINDDTPLGTTITSQVVAKASNVDMPVEDIEQVLVDIAPNLLLTKQPDRSIVEPGGLITYTLAYTNHGSTTAQKTRLNDHLPVEVIFVSAKPEPDQIAGSVLTWVLGDISKGESGTISLTVRARPNLVDAWEIKNNITSATVGHEAQSELSKVAVQIPRLNLTKEVDAIRDTLTTGDRLIYSLIVRNPSDLDVHNVTLVDTLHTSLELESVQSDAQVQINGQILEATWASFPANESDTLIVNTRIRFMDPLPEIVSNRAWLTTSYEVKASNITITPLMPPLSGVDGLVTQQENIIPGEKLEIILQDIDLNISSTEIDTVLVTTKNMRTGEQETSVLRETGPNTGEFFGTIATYLDSVEGDSFDGTLFALAEDSILTLYNDINTTSGIPQERTAATVVLATRITLVPNPMTIVANGSDQSILTARVTDEHDRSLPDGTLVVFTADKGTFENGENTITVSVAGGNGEAVTYLIAPVLDEPDVAQVFASFGGFDSDVVNLEVLPGAVAIRVFDQERGVVVTANDPDLEVTVTLEGSTVAGTFVSMTIDVDEKGLFIVPDIPPGNYNLQVKISETSTDRVIFEGILQKITVKADGSTTPPKNAINGMVRGKNELNGARYAGASVDLVDDQGIVVASAVLDAEGRYDFQDISPGDYILKVELLDGTKAEIPVNPSIRLIGGIVVNADILIDPFGRTFDASTGEIIPDVTVTIQTLTGEALQIPSLNGTGAVPNINNDNPFITTPSGQFSFLFGGNQVGSLDNPVTYVMTVKPPEGSSYLPRRIYIIVSPSMDGPVDQVPITMRAVSADGLELAISNSFTLTRDTVIIPNIEIIAFNIPLFSLAPVIEFTKYASRNTVVPGQTMGFSLAVANIGNETAKNVTVTDTLSTDWNLLTSSDGEIEGPNILRWTVGDLAPGQQDTLAIQTEIVPPQPDGLILTNRAALFIDEILSITTEANVTVRSGLALQKQADVDSVGPGQMVSYTLTYTNISTETVSGNTLIDSLPPGLIPVSAPNGLINSQVISWNLENVPVGQTGKVVFTVQASDSLRTGEHIVNSAVILDEFSQTVTSASSTLPVRSPKLSLTKVVSDDVVTTGTEVVFSLIVNNEDSFSIPGPITLVDSLSTAVTLVSATGNPSINEHVLSWSIDSLSPGLMDTIFVRTRVITENPSLTNTAFLLKDEQTITADTATVTIIPTTALWLTKNADIPVAKPGEIINYEIAIGSNNDTLNNVKVSDTLPAELTYVVGSSQPSAAYDSLSHSLTWTLPELVPGNSLKLQFGLMPRDNLSPGEILTENIAIALVDSVNFESNTAEVIISVPFFIIQKIANPTVAETGDFVIYQVLLKNLSQLDDLTDLIVRDRLPYGFEYVRETARLDGQKAEPDSLTGRDVVWKIPDLNAGKTRLLTYRLLLGSDAGTGDGINIVSASATTSRGYALSAGTAQANVRIRPELFSLDEVILGRAWVDLNEDGLHNGNEPPVPGIALMMEDGTRIIADSQGRFSIPEVIAGDHVIRLLNKNVPPGLEPMVLGTRSSHDPWIRFVTISQSGMAKANFPFRSTEEPFTIRKTVRPKAPTARIWIERTVRKEATDSDVELEKFMTLGSMSFDSGDAYLTESAQQILQGFLSGLMSCPDQLIMVSGYTDTTPVTAGKFPNNTVLSLARADAVKAWLVSAGIDSSRIITRGFGPRSPVASNQTVEGRRQNRRVEISQVVIPSIRFTVVFTLQVLGLQLKEPFIITQPVKTGLEKSSQNSLKTFTLATGDSVRFHITASSDDVSDLPSPQVEYPDTGQLSLSLLGQDTSLGRSEVWSAEIPGSWLTEPESGEVWAGAVLNYELSVVAPQGVQIVDTLPSGVTFIKADSLAEVSGNTVHWAVPESANHDSLSLWATVKVNPNFEGILQNKAVLQIPSQKTTMNENLIASPEDSIKVKVIPRPVWEVSTHILPDTLFAQKEAETLFALGSILFPVGRADLSLFARQNLQNFMNRITATPKQQIIIHGHTDSSPISTRRFDNNDHLSQERAEAVRDWLVSAGIDSSRIITQSFGARSPVASNSKSENRAQNRRADLRLKYSKEPVVFQEMLSVTTTIINNGIETVPRVHLADSLCVWMTYRVGSASIPPLLKDNKLIWDFQDVQPGDSLKVFYQIDTLGKTVKSTTLSIHSIVSYGLPDGQWVTEPPVTSRLPVIVPNKDSSQEGER
ncbi:OmpA family protein [Candidatus Latescibacterota bacterium]